MIITQKKRNELSENLLNNKITIEDLILTYSIYDAAELYENAFKIDINSGNGASLIKNVSLAVSFNNNEEEFYEKLLDYIKYINKSSERIVFNGLRVIIDSIISGFTDEYREKIASEIFNLAEPYLKKLMSSKKSDGKSKDKLITFCLNLMMPDTLSFEKEFKSFFEDKTLEDILYIIGCLHYFKIYEFTSVIDLEKFNNPELIFSKLEEDEISYSNLYSTFNDLIDISDDFIKNSVLTGKDIFKFIFKWELKSSFQYVYKPFNPAIKPRVDRVISIIKKTLGEEKGKKYIKDHLFKTFSTSDIQYLISAFPFKDYEEYIPDTKTGKEIKKLISLNINSLSAEDIKSIKKLPVPEQNKFLSNPNVSMDIVKEIMGKRYVSQELLKLVKERRPGDILEFCKLKARQYILNSMKDELTELKDMGLIEDIIIDFKIPEGQEDSLNLYLNLKG